MKTLSFVYPYNSKSPKPEACSGEAEGSVKTVIQELGEDNSMREGYNG